MLIVFFIIRFYFVFEVIKMIIFDGHEYEDEADLPDIGTFRCDTMENGKRNYIGLSADVSKLPKKSVYPEYTDLKTGSTAYCVDTTELYMYEASNDNWTEQ